MKKIILMLIILLVLVGGYLYFKNDLVIMPNNTNQENNPTSEKINENELRTKINDTTSLNEKDIKVIEDPLSYELEDGEHFVFINDYGIKDGEPFIIFDKIQANFNDSKNFPVFTNNNTLKRKLFLSRGSAYLGTAQEVKEDYWYTKSISSLGGQGLFELGNEQNNITNFINKNNILVITVADNKIWSIRYTNLDLKLEKVNYLKELDDGSYGGFYVNFFKKENTYYLTLDASGIDSVSIRIDKSAKIEMVGAGLDTEKTITIEEFKNIAYDFERLWYRVSVEIKNNTITKVLFYMNRP